MTPSYPGFLGDSIRTGKRCCDWLRRGWLIAGLMLVATAASQIQASSALPILGDDTAILTPAQEKQLGQAWLRQLRGQVDLLEQPLLQEYVHDLIYRLVPASELSDPSLTTIVIDAPALNAFAVPGGIIGVNAGLFLHAQNEGELAAVLAHELAHLSQRHFARRQSASGKQLAINLAGILAAVVLAATSDKDAAMAALASSQALSIQQELGYSRANEREADRIGLRTLETAGWSGQAMADMFKRMLEAQRYSGSVPEYLRSHPLTEQRIADIESRFDAREDALTGGRLSSAEFQLVQAWSRAWYAWQSRETASGFEDVVSPTEPGQSRSVASMALDFGRASYALLNQRPADAAAAVERVQHYQEAPLARIWLKAWYLQEDRRAGEAVDLLEGALKQFPGNYLLSRSYANALAARKRYPEAVQTLEALSRRHAADTGLWFELAEYAGLADDRSQLRMARAEYFFLRGRYDAAIQQLEAARKDDDLSHQQRLIARERLREIQAASVFQP